MKSTYLRGASCIALLIASSFWAQSAQAATAAASTNAAPATEVSEVTVTGSLIQGTPENAALPVTVLTNDSIQKQGSPTIVELVKQLPESSGIIGESNQFAAAGRGQGQYGQATINLRGLGPERTLVLFNGHRLPLAEAFAVDSVMLPLSAIGRVEVLKDGAAATYGSDAIAGVVNFITKKNVNGLEVGGDYRWITGSKGDYTLNATWGHTSDNWNIMVSGGFQHRSELPILGKDFAHQPYNANPEGGWTGGGNPEAFIPTGLDGSGNIVAIAGSRVDIGCTDVGGVLTQPKAATSPILGYTSCRGQYSIWDNLEEETDSYQLYSEFNVDLGGSHKLHLEAAYGYTNLPFFKSSPSYVTTRPVPNTVLPANMLPVPGNGFLLPTSVPPATFFYYVPATNPGFAAYLAANPGQFPAGTQGAYMQVGTFRPFLTGGNPLYDYKHGVGGRYWHKQINLNAELKGDLAEDVHYDASLTWGRYDYYGEGRDSLTDRLELALRGLGGPSCDFRTGTPGVGGCMWLNPFSNAIPGAPNRGLVNPGYNSSVANSAALADWLLPIQTSRLRFEDIEGDFVLNGKFPWELPGGNIGWAAGAQWRHNSYVTNYSLYGNSVLSPCADAALPGGAANCPVNSSPNTGPNVFGPVSNPVNLSQNIYALYGELSVPVTDALNFDLAARYEDYGANGGHTFNPQLRGKWQLTDFFALRGSVGSTFRAPPQGFLIPDAATGLQNVLGTFIPVSSIGNPALQPETAVTWSVGGILETGELHATVDYWDYNFKKVLTTEPLTQVVSALFPNGGSDNCSTLSAPFISSHFVFSGACGRGNVVAVNLLRINGPSIKTDGVDFNVSYRFRDVVNGDLTVGGMATYVREYKISSFSIGGIPISGFDAAGFYNSGTIAYPIPKWKGQLWANFEVGGFNIRWTARYVDSYTDQRASLFSWNATYQTGTVAQCGNPSTTTAATVITPQCGWVTRGQRIGSSLLHDLAIRVPLPWDTVMTASITNIFDRDPPFARTEINYDPLTGDPLGRTVKIGVQKKF